MTLCMERKPRLRENSPRLRAFKFPKEIRLDKLPKIFLAMKMYPTGINTSMHVKKMEKRIRLR